MKFLKTFESFQTLILIHNKEKATYLGKLYWQYVEPAGYYDNLYHNYVPNDNFEIVQYTYSNALFIIVSDENLVKCKYDLSKKYKANGKNLTEKLLSIGYDIIITKYDNDDFGEIIILDTSKIKKYDTSQENNSWNTWTFWSWW